jgi:acyl carrier protein
MNRDLTRWEIVGLVASVVGLLLWFSSGLTGLRWYVYVPVILTGLIPFVLETRQYEKRLTASVRDRLSSRPQLDPQGFANYYFPENQRSVAVFIRREMDSYVPFSLAGLHPDDRFIADLQLDFWDDLAAAELVRHAEKHFRIKIPNSDAQKIFTIRELIVLVQMKIEEAVRKSESR